MTRSGQRHISVLGRQAIEMLGPREGGIYVDATFGAGGYSRAILDVPGTRVIGIDRDRSAISGGFELVDRSAGRLTLVEDRFSNLAEVCAAAGYRFLESLFSGKFLYVDDLVTRESDRSCGFGGQLLDWLIEQAREHGCENLELDSGVQRFDAHRFYFSKRMSISSYHFRIKIEPKE